MINLERYGDAPALVGRLFFSSMFLAFSYGKLTAFGGTSGHTTSLGLPAPALEPISKLEARVDRR